MANVFESHGLLRNKMRVASLTSRQKSRKTSPHPSPPQKSGRELFLTRVERKLTPPFHSGLLMSLKTRGSPAQLAMTPDSAYLQDHSAPVQLFHAGRIMVLEHTTIWHFTAKWSFFARYRKQNQPPPQPSPKIGEGAVFNQSGKEANASFPLWTPHVSENQRLAGSISHDSGLRISPKPQRSDTVISRRANHGSGTHHNLALHRKMEFLARSWRETPYKIQFPRPRAGAGGGQMSSNRTNCSEIKCV